MTDQRTLKRIIKEQREQIEKFKQIAVHVQEHCCDDCEDTSMCEFGCAITELKQSIVTEHKSPEMPDANMSKSKVPEAVLGVPSGGSQDNSCVEKEKEIPK